MRSLEAAEVRRVQLAVLDRFAQLCADAGIEWFLAAGTLLGAVRHRGFIPWDDDVDVMVPRGDYERLCALFETARPSGLELASSRRGGYPFPFAKVYDVRTELHEAIVPMPAVGVGIDLFPIDGWPEGRLRRGLRRAVLRAASTYLLYATLGGADRPWRRAVLRGCLGLAGLAPAPSRLARVADRIASAPPTGRPYVGVACWGYHEVVDAAAYATSVMVSFEGRALPAPVGYDVVLKALYGDYLTPPPENARRAPHVQRAFWREAAETSPDPVP